METAVINAARPALAPLPGPGADPLLDPAITAHSPKAERLPSFRTLSKIAAAGEEEPPPVAPMYPELPEIGLQPQREYDVADDTAPVPPARGIPYPAANPTAAAFPATSPYYQQPRRRSLAGNISNNLSYPSTSSSSEGLTLHDTVNEDPVPESKAPVASTVSGHHVCDYPGCTAPPFQTQYLLNSHANVHSSSRPHFCPVAGCARAVGGKGFKRKNEMIRHGLVHDSPGYMCPFCQDKEHKYPRPDNLQRHVRVHHPDRDKDDPLLRDVLAQRLDGVKSRRRRTGP